jgi:hypothetical protein
VAEGAASTGVKLLVPYQGYISYAASPASTCLGSWTPAAHAILHSVSLQFPSANTKWRIRTVAQHAYNSEAAHKRSATFNIRSR